MKPEAKIIARIKKSCDLLWGKDYFWLKIPDATMAQRFIPTKPFDLLIARNLAVLKTDGLWGGEPKLYAIEVKATDKKSIPKSRILVDNQLCGVRDFDDLGDNFHGFWLIAFIHEKDITIYNLCIEGIFHLNRYSDVKKKSFTENEFKTASVLQPVILHRGDYLNITDMSVFKREKK